MDVSQKRWGSGDMRGPSDSQLTADSAWAYRARQGDDLAEVRIVKVGVRRPKRVLVRFVDDAFEGLTEWVPPARLKARWAERGQLLAWEERWRKLTCVSPDYEAPELRAADTVIDTLVEQSLAETGWNATRGVLTIHDVEGLAGVLAVVPDWLRSDPLSFEEEGELIVSWDMTQRVAIRAAQRDPHPVLADVEAQERRARQEAVYGRCYSSRAGLRSEYIEPEDCARADTDRLLPVRTLLRRWCGQEPNDLRNEVIELRREIARVAGLLEDTIAALRQRGHTRDANRFEKKFMKPFSHTADPTQDRDRGTHESRLTQPTSRDQQPAAATPWELPPHQ